MRIASALLLVALPASLGACGGSRSQGSTRPSHRATATVAPRPAHYRLRLTAHLTGGRIVVAGRTNVPENSRIQVGAWRAFRQAHGEVRAGRIGRGAVPPPASGVVRNGHFSASIPLQEHTLLLGFDPADDPEGPIAEIDRDATVCAEFMTGRDTIDNGPWEQPDARVRAAVGDWGKHLRGSAHVHIFGSLTKHPSRYIEVAKRIPAPTGRVLNAIARVQAQVPKVRSLAGFCAF